MEKEIKKSDDSSEEKIVNLCEDMNPHVHDQESYEKMKTLQDSQK